MKDAGEILIFAYKNYTDDEETSIEEIIEETNWEEKRIKRALDYLEELYTINPRKALGGYYCITKLHPTGIQMIEDVEKFKTTFGFEVNLGLFKFSVAKSEK